MALWTLTIKSTKIMNGVRLERGMRVQVSSLYHPIGYNNGEATRDAFMRVYAYLYGKRACFCRRCGESR